MSEQGIRALLSYMHCREIDLETNGLAVALELITAADKYNVDGLRSHVSSFVLSEPSSWFKTQLEETLALYFFANNLNGAADLRQKAITVFKE